MRTSMQTWQEVTVPQPDHDVTLRLPDEKWVELEEVGRWERSHRIDKLRLWRKTPQ
jgi:hypothetical protein